MNDEISRFWEARLMTSLYLSATILLLYDVVLTLGAEVNVVRHRKLSVHTILHIMNRHGMIACLIPISILCFPVTDTNRCHVLGKFAEIAMFPTNISWAVFSALRTYALSNFNIALAILVFIVNAMYIMPDIYTLIYGTLHNFPYPDGCMVMLPINRTYFARTMDVARRDDRGRVYSLGMYREEDYILAASGYPSTPRVWADPYALRNASPTRHCMLLVSISLVHAELNTSN
ncbi:hypothetical protein C8Q74DRAFT_1222366 [Fomes fomentarius]|nr:hypothetical protein C8Q74DRAFT_1222366 [Fomes fomentarius]